MPRERINFTFHPRNMSLSLLIGFGFVRAVVACVILKNLDDCTSHCSCDKAEPPVLSRHLKNCSKALQSCNCSKLLSFNPDLPLDAILAVYHKFGLFSTYIHFIHCAGFTYRENIFSTKFVYFQTCTTVFICKDEYSCHKPYHSFLI